MSCYDRFMARSYDEMEAELQEGRGLYSAEHVVLFDDRAYPGLVKKVETVMRSGHYSPKMVAIMGRILGQRWTNPEMQELAVDGSGFVVEAFGGIVGEADSLEGNLTKVFADAELSDSELDLSHRLVVSSIARLDGKQFFEPAPDVDL